MLSKKLIDELILIARDEWNRELTPAEASELAEWLVTAYRALLEK